MAYAEDLKSFVLYGTCGFDPHPGHLMQKTYGALVFQGSLRNGHFCCAWVVLRFEMARQAPRSFAKILLRGDVRRRIKDGCDQTHASKG
jgi:hypothetical protein